MAIQTDKTYIFTTRIQQSNGASRGDKDSIDASALPIYAPYQGMLETDELRGSSTNDVLVLVNGKWVQATRGNYGLDIYLNDGFRTRTPRARDNVNVFDVVIEKFREELDLAGNTNPLYLLQVSLGGMGTGIDPNDIDLNHLSHETTEFIEDKVADLYAQLQSEGKDPYCIDFECQGETAAADPILDRSNLLKYSSQRGMPIYPKIVFPISWSVGFLATLDKWVNNNSNVFWCYGDSYQDVIDLCEAQDASIDSTNTATYTQDGVHFFGTIQVLYGLMAMPRLIQLASGF